MSAKEHSDKVRLDPKLVSSVFPKNKFKLIYPLDEGKGT